jgi:hypothetical protein
MTKEMMEGMILRTLKSGGGITQAKGHVQEIIVTLMSSTCSIGIFFFFHTYLVVARTEIKFGKLLSTTQFIQKVINDMNGKFVFECEFVEGTKIWTHVPSAFFLEYHEYRRKIRDGTRMVNTC